jgi:hypothetical protein
MKIGIHLPAAEPVDGWIPAFAGMTNKVGKGHGKSSAPCLSRI